MGHGNHWECLGGTVEERVRQFIPITVAKGRLGTPVSRKARWFDRKRPATETIHPLVYPATPLGCMAIVVSDTPKRTNAFYTGFPCSAAGGKRRLRIVEIRDWGNEVEGELFCEMADGGAMVGFFDTHYFANRDKYAVGDEYDFQLSGLIYEARCTNAETVTVTDQAVLEERFAARRVKPARLPDGTLPPDVIHIAGCTGLGPTAKYPDDAEFYCVIGEVSEFDLEGIRIFQITPEIADEDGEKVPLPRVIFGAAAVLKDDYVPKVGDSIGGMLWVQGFLDEPPRKKPA